MAKRLTKALRDKRRWIGIAVPSSITSRIKLEELISEIATVDDWRLYDFKNSTAILRILLKDQDEWRKVLANGASEIHSMTMSGKIRLVRKRLGIEPE